MVKISVIMAVYNTEEFVASAIESVLNQSLKEIELLCVNDGSTDGSLDILNEYASKDKRVHVFSHENRGASYTRNVALAQATGEYIHILDGDDMMPEGAYERMYERAKENVLDILFFDSQIIFDDASLAKKHADYVKYYKREREYGEITTGEELFCRLSADNAYLSQASMYLINGDFQKKNNITFFEGITHEDQLFTFLCIMAAKRVSHINELLFIRRIRGNSAITGTLRIENVIGLLTCFDEMYHYVRSNNIDESTQRAAIKELSKVAQSGILKYSQLPDEERMKVANSSFYVQMFISSFGNSYLQLYMNQKQHAQIEDIYKSRSWRITKPLRIISRLIKRIFRKY